MRGGYIFGASTVERLGWFVVFGRVLIGPPPAYVGRFGNERIEESSMPHGTVTAAIPARSADVFRLLHDYGRRLRWDTLLQSARLCDNFTHAQIHATSICTGHWYLARIAMKTEYVTFKPPTVAAVKLLNRPLFIETFAAAIRHHDQADGSSLIEYKYRFSARPSWLRWLLHPVMAAVFRWQTRKRLRALRKYFSDYPVRNLSSASEVAE